MRCSGREVTDRHRGRGADHARLLDLRHDHHLRPHPREHPADEAGRIVPRARQRVAVGDDAALARRSTFITLVPIMSLLPLRRRHAEGLRLRDAVGIGSARVLVDLRRRAAADRAHRSASLEYARRRDDESLEDVQSVGGALLRDDDDAGGQPAVAPRGPTPTPPAPRDRRAPAISAPRRRSVNGAGSGARHALTAALASARGSLSPL